MKPSSSQAMTSPSDLKYAAIYARVSTEDQGKGYSIPTQVEACHIFARQQGYIVPERYVFTDDLTGTILERPVL
jgi:site-specific DNA recombinase